MSDTVTETKPQRVKPPRQPIQQGAAASQPPQAPAPAQQPAATPAASMLPTDTTPMPPQEAGAVTADVSDAAPAADAKTPYDEGEAGPATRFVRVPFGAQTQKLYYPPREGFHRHWFNDTPGRIQRATQAGYAHVQENGAPVSRPVGVREGGGAMIGFLMEIPEEWFQEDQALHQARVDEIDQAIGAGNLEPDRRQQGYIPQTGISIRSTAR